MKQVSISEILISSLLISFLMICSQEAVKTYKVNGLECEMCPPGTYWKANCKEGNNQSVCEDCPLGTYSSTENIATHCEACRREGTCPKRTVFKNTCNVTTNNRCDCRDGYFWEDIEGHDGRCYRHSTCKENEEVIKEGTPTNDTVCGPKTTGPTSTVGEKESDSYATTTTGIPDSTVGTKEESELTNLQVAGILIIMLIVVVLFVVVPYCLYSRQNDKNQPEKIKFELLNKLIENTPEKLIKRKNRTI